MQLFMNDLLKKHKNYSEESKFAQRSGNMQKSLRISLSGDSAAIPALLLLFRNRSDST
jgi:hypothetical protein